MLATTCRFEWISLLGLFLTLFLFLIADAQAARMRSHPESLPPSIMQQQKLKAEAISAQYAVSWYGNWCGGGHGGYQDCCNGTACPACVTTVPNKCDAGPGEDWAECGPNKECFEQCPPVDDMDWACASHDSCCIRNRLPPSLPSCFPEGNYCWCDCNLVANVRQIECTTWACWSFKEMITNAFEYSLACWAFTYTNATGEPYCDGVVNRKEPIDQYCI